MKTTTRFLLGLFSSLLLSVGFLHAAEVCDRHVNPAKVERGVALPAPDCTQPSEYLR